MAHGPPHAVAAPPPGHSWAYPAGVAVDSSGNIYIADSYQAVICELDASTGSISIVAGTADTPGYSGDGGSATSAELDNPSALAFDKSGNLYIADTGNNVIREIDASTGVISTVAGNGTKGYSGDGGAATSAQLSDPTGVALDNSGNLFIADTGNKRIREVSLNPTDTKDLGNITTVAGGGAGTGVLGNVFTSPTGVFVDYAGSIFVSDQAVVSRSSRLPAAASHLRPAAHLPR